MIKEGTLENMDTKQKINIQQGIDIPNNFLSISNHVKRFIDTTVSKDRLSSDDIF